MVTSAQYGSWTSPLTPDQFSKGNCKAICEMQVNSDGVFWVEQSAVTGKRELYFRGHHNDERIRWAQNQSVQNSVHEYGGGSFIPTQEGSVVFTTVEGLYEQKKYDIVPVELANSMDKTFRFADFSVTSNIIFCVNESHQIKGEDPINRLISVNRLTKNQQVIATGADFYACPRVSPDGKKIAWMQWNHINMPWDETSIYIADINSDGTATNIKKIRDGVGKNVNYYNPVWGSTNELYLVHDATNYWNLYKIDLATDTETNIYPVDKEIGNPLWQFSDRSFATSQRHIVMRVGEQLILKEGDSIKSISTPGFTYFSHLSITESGIIYAIASGPVRPSSLIKVDNDMSLSIIREARDSRELENFDISEPELLTFESDNVKVSGYFYSPKNRNFEGLNGTLPPVILYGHGGPTSCALPCLDLRKQFFTSRGFAVFDVNYRGSTSYGSEFRNMLKRNWGVVDRDDMINGARFLIDTGRVDPEKVCIMGSSAGGYLVLNALIHSDVFKAAVSIYGVADLLDLVKETHKFEKGYNESLIGKYPEEKHIYDERSPINHIDKLNTPTVFLHGLEDTVVPSSQSVTMFEKLRDKGITTALQMYENEGHGFRGGDAVRRSNEASYYFLCKALSISPSIKSDLDIFNLKSHI